MLAWNHDICHGNGNGSGYGYSYYYDVVMVVIISMLVMCNAIFMTENCRKRLGLSNASLDMTYENSSIEISPKLNQ